MQPDDQQKKSRQIQPEDIEATILDELSRQPGGLTRSQIRDLFARHNSQAVEAALESMRMNGKLRMQLVSSGGRPAERWFSNAGGGGLGVPIARLPEE